MNKLELNEKLIELYGLKSLFQAFAGFDVNRDVVYGYIQIIDDSEIMFDLMIEHHISITFYPFGVIAYLNTDEHGNTLEEIDADFKDHETSQEAARFAIALALVELAESK